MNRLAALSLSRLLLAAALGCLAGCGGGDHGAPSPATKLHYANPPATGYRLEVDPATNDQTHLVLNLVGPKGTAVQGVAFFLTSEAAKLTWGNPGGSDPFAKAGNALALGTVPLFKSKQLQGTGDLQVGIFQTGSAAAVLGSTPLVSVALDLKAGTGVLAGTRLTLTATAGKTSTFLDATGTAQPMTIGLGELSAQ